MVMAYCAQRADLRGDLVAGVTVSALLVPQGLAYALLAGPLIGNAVSAYFNAANLAAAHTSVEKKLP